MSEARNKKIDKIVFEDTAEADTLWGGPINRDEDEYRVRVEVYVWIKSKQTLGKWFPLKRERVVDLEGLNENEVKFLKQRAREIETDLKGDE